MIFRVLNLPDVEMSSNVVHHVTLGAETEPAVLRTRKGPVICVNEHVRF